MANKLAKTVMRNISSKNLKDRDINARRSIGKRADIETIRSYGRKGQTSKQKETKEANKRYDRQKTMLLSNYSSLGNSNRYIPSKPASRPAPRRVKKISSLARVLKSQEVTRSDGGSKKEIRNPSKANKQGMTLGELSQAKGRNLKAERTSEGGDRSSKLNKGRSKKLTLDSLAKSMKNNN